MNQQLSELGGVIQRHTEEAPKTKRVLAEGRSRLQVSVYERSLRRSLTLHSAAPWILAAAVATLGVFFAWPSQDGPLSVAIEAQQSDVVGRWIGANDETKQLRFSDGTSLSLHPKTKVRVSETTADGASVVLGEGRALAQVEPKKGARWKFFAGPFTVRVTGTEFDLAWDPGDGVLELALHQGSVELDGPTLGGARKVQKGEFVRVELPRPQAAKKTQNTSAPSENSEKALPSEESTSRPTAPQGASAASDWRALLSQNEQVAALLEVDRVGSAHVLAAASQKELWSLAHAARVHGRPALAKDALLALRNKHGTRGQSSYLLGKIHADQLHAPAEAIRWFETYLNEASGGGLSEQALGRLVELQAGTVRGKRAARQYLERYPQGSYAAFARSLVR